MSLSQSKTDPRGAKKKRQSNRPKGGGRPQGGKPGGKPPRGGKGARKEMPYVLRAVEGGIGVFRRPVGNRAEDTTCGVMPNRKLADALVAQLKRAESVVSDLFLEATEDGIEALEAVLAACRDAVIKQNQPREARPRGGDRDEGQGGRKPRRGRGRRRGRGPRGADAGGGDGAPDGAAGPG